MLLTYLTIIGQSRSVKSPGCAIVTMHLSIARTIIALRAIAGLPHRATSRNALHPAGFSRVHVSARVFTPGYCQPSRHQHHEPNRRASQGVYGATPLRKGGARRHPRYVLSTPRLRAFPSSRPICSPPDRSPAILASRTPQCGRSRDPQCSFRVCVLGVVSSVWPRPRPDGR